MIILRGPDGDRQIADNTPYRRLPGEYVLRGVPPTAQASDVHEAELQEQADKNNIGAGDLVAKVFKDTGFKAWWDEKHGGECAPCQSRQATLNYIKFKGPQWLTQWVNNK